MNVIVNGSNGRMGRELVALIRSGEAGGVSLACAVDPFNKASGDFPIAERLCDFDGAADCIIDFSHHSSAPALCSYAARRGIALVVATTAHDAEEMKIIRKTSLEVPVFMSANMSLGIAVAGRLVRIAASLFPGADVEIIETHHASKEDLPSGTALDLAKSASDVTGGEIAVGRTRGGGRVGNEICIHSVRAGRSAGDHKVMLFAGAETLCISHHAHSRAVFAQGALAAARFIAGRAPGMYSMEDLVGEN